MIPGRASHVQRDVGKFAFPAKADFPTSRFTCDALPGTIKTIIERIFRLIDNGILQEDPSFQLDLAFAALFPEDKNDIPGYAAKFPASKTDKNWPQIDETAICDDDRDDDRPSCTAIDPSALDPSALDPLAPVVEATVVQKCVQHDP